MLRIWRRDCALCVIGNEFPCRQPHNHSATLFPMAAAFLLPLAQGACIALGGDLAADAFGVVAMVAMTPLITIQVLGLMSEVSSARPRRALLASQAALSQEDEYAVIEL